jgi:hypothetical protein
LQQSGAVARQAGTAAVAAQISETAAEALPDEAAVRARAADFSTQWRLTSRERRVRGFGTLYQTLVTGELDTESGVQQITAVPKERARQLADLLGTLYDRVAGQTTADAQVQLERALEEQRTLLDAARKLVEAARATRQPFEPVEILPLDPLLGLLRANWPEYRQVVRLTWPEGRGADAAHALDALLAQSEAPHDAEPS